MWRAVSQKPAGGKRYKVIYIEAHLPPKAYISLPFFARRLSAGGLSVIIAVKLMSNKRFTFWLMLVSFLGLVALMTTTNPIDKVIYTVIFFILGLVFMVSFGFWLVRLQLGEVSPKNRYRIIALSLIILTLLMFRSAQSLSWVDALILLLITFGLGFYISRRA